MTILTINRPTTEPTDTSTTIDVISVGGFIPPKSAPASASNRLSPADKAMLTLGVITATIALFAAGMWLAHLTAAFVVFLGKIALAAAGLAIVAVIIGSIGRRHCQACPGIRGR